jgi:hypothetical protein
MGSIYITHEETINIYAKLYFETSVETNLYIDWRIILMRILE